jgi:sulfite exporter TauE/SafE
MNSMTILLATAVSAGFIHTLLGPDHYIPFIVMSKARNWSLRQTLFTTVYCGLGHVGSSILIGFAGIALGYGISRIEGFETVRGSLAGWAFFIFGFAYMVWGIFKAIKNKPHVHVHFHSDGKAHEHEHTHHTEHVHVHQKSAQLLTPWVLFIIFVLGPCEILIPLVMIPAANHDTNGIVAVSLLFSITTVLTMCTAVTVGYYGLKVLPTAKIDRFMHVIAGATICLSGFAMLFLDM